MSNDPTVRIIHLDQATLAALAQGDRALAEVTSPVALSDWLAGPDCTGTWAMRARQVLETPDDLPWVTGVVWDDERGLAVGKAGFHGAPSEHGMVEVGYAIDPELRRRGYARASLSVLIARARREPAVTVLRATISPSNAASLALLSQFPFLEVGEQWDDEDGLEITYELPVD
ncbi:GNAT family N-acetyltransferase [Nocardioides sp.]|uniref:GNAT family N-acetyltransferase n=1 Tax=Nocardioides sp. TaxID=35761 RepID=UPI00356303F7